MLSWLFQQPVPTASEGVSHIFPKDEAKPGVDPKHHTEGLCTTFNFSCVLKAITEGAVQDPFK